MGMRYESAISYCKFINIIDLSIDGEVWKEHPLYAGYFGSNFGRIKYYHKKEKRYKIKIQYLDKRHNRFVLHIWYEKQHTLRSSRFILECFNGINHEMFVDHIDSNPWYNDICNLRYVTRLENNNNPNSRKKYKPSLSTNDFRRIEQIDITSGKVINVFERFKSIEDELCLPFNAHKNIVTVCNGRQKTAYGYKWRYAKDEVVEGEVWKWHPYLKLECSNVGRVRWKSRGKFHITYGGKHTCGYLMVQFGGKKYLVHRLVAETFLTNHGNKPQVNHIDCNPYNNSIDNLEFCTVRDNMLSKKTHDKLSIKVKSRDKYGVEKHYSSIREARREGFCGDCIRKCLKGLQKEHKGLEWYLDK